ncbi:MAG TPA: hypothetical protein VEJ18_14435, partial [Planctomycetota bacterium]|nr:hypothetical protein [Planctomycetota bacterium]
MDDRQALLSYARRARRRLGLVRAADVLCRALFHAALLALLAVVIFKALGQPVPWRAGLAGLGSAAALVAILAAFFPRVSLGEAAARVDAAAGWKERLSSALAVGVPSHPMEAALIEDVRARLDRTSPASLLPLRAPRELKGLPVAAALVALAAWLLPP